MPWRTRRSGADELSFIWQPPAGSGDAAGAGEERGDDVGGVPVEGLAATVVAHRRAWVGVTGRFLDVT
jgi:hypothetical protein